MEGVCIFIALGIVLPIVIMKVALRWGPVKDAPKPTPSAHCDICASKVNTAPVYPVVRCPSCMWGSYVLSGDSLFGFDFKTHCAAKEEAP